MDTTFLITGATGNLGRAVIKELSARKVKLVLLARNSSNLKKLQAENQNVIYSFSYDLEDTSHIETIFQSCSSQGILLNGLIHCAGINESMPIQINDTDSMDRMMRINLFSFVEMGKYFSRKKYTAENSSIVAISSMAAVENPKGMCLYSASKAALNSTVQTMAKELMTRKTRVNAIMPGYLEQKMVNEKQFLTDEAVKKVQPLGLINCSNVAKLTAFLVSKDARYITGALLPIGGGQII